MDGGVCHHHVRLDDLSGNLCGCYLPQAPAHRFPSGHDALQGEEGHAHHLQRDLRPLQRVYQRHHVQRHQASGRQQDHDAEDPPAAGVHRHSHQPAARSDPPDPGHHQAGQGERGEPRHLQALHGSGRLRARVERKESSDE